ncbi:MAG TPA: alpha/beta hydrolase [Chitinophagaceae bacterium]|nr:alpha/beta hydrolase [Chitinophagaceae bacterium]
MLLKRRFVLPLLIILAWIGARNCRILELRMTDKEIRETVSGLPVPYKIVHATVNNRSVRYLEVGYDSLPKLICLHGSPSSLSAWRTIYTDTAFLKNYQVIAIDRPGYGYSDFGRVETDLQKQVSTLQVIIDSLTQKHKAILFGSSYGGPVAAQLAMNMPDRISQLVLLSASLMPGREKTYWISYPMTTPVLKYLFPPTFVMSSEEKLVHKQQLETLSHWDKIRSDVLIIHGNRDGLVYYDNAEYARKKLVKAKSVKTITMNGKGHSIIFSRPDFIKRILRQYLSLNRN